MVPGEAARDDTGLWDFARNTRGTVFHCVGTCRMGRDPQAVLDPQLRVRGVERLRDRRLGDAPDHLSQHQCDQPDDRRTRRRAGQGVTAWPGFGRTRWN
ncbi:GMC oxidoreductase [Bradyrhizobium sp. NBAIM08]|uniref:GMC oxidoreductase n=1 Tax=Bradyrhizobium sp. NBAIM08 TaxID=2793815 RepID=UPI0034D1B396